jgi:hypothetical protein
MDLSPRSRPNAGLPGRCTFNACGCANCVFMLDDYPTARLPHLVVPLLDRAENRFGLCQLSGAELEMQMQRHMLKWERGLEVRLSSMDPAPQKTTKKWADDDVPNLPMKSRQDKESRDW